MVVVLGVAKMVVGIPWARQVPIFAKVHASCAHMLSARWGILCARRPFFCTWLSVCTGIMKETKEVTNMLTARMKSNWLMEGGKDGT